MEEGLKRELGADIAAAKWPHFFAFDDFRAERCGRDFDFLVAQSILSHTGPDLLDRVLDGFREALAADGLAVVTVVHPEKTGGVERLQPVLGLSRLRVLWPHPLARGARYCRASWARVVVATSSADVVGVGS